MTCSNMYCKLARKQRLAFRRILYRSWENNISLSLSSPLSSESFAAAVGFEKQKVIGSADWQMKNKRRKKTCGYCCLFSGKWKKVCSNGRGDRLDKHVTAIWGGNTTTEFFQVELMSGLSLVEII